MKRGLGFLFLFSLIIIPSISFISANVLDNILGRMSGRVVDENILCGSVDMEVYFMSNPDSKTILHRITRGCESDSPLLDQYGRIEQIFPVGSASGYNNYKCSSRKQEQCYGDGSFDTYYDERCDYLVNPQYTTLNYQTLSLNLGETKEVFGTYITLNGFVDTDTANLVTKLKPGVAKNFNPLMFPSEKTKSVDFNTNFDINLNGEVNVRELYNYIHISNIKIDEGCIQNNETEEGECSQGSIQLCGTNVGECYVGYMICQENGFWGECLNDGEPMEEICDQIDNDCDGSVDEENVCNSNTTKCTDSDAGNSINQYSIKGRTISESGGTGIVSLDYCNEDGIVLIENYCNADSTIGKEKYVCPGGCVEGACAGLENNGGCVDSDGGVDYYVRGIVSYGEGSVTSDQCNNEYPDGGIEGYGSETLLERECVGEEVQTIFYDCSQRGYCEYGKCVVAGSNETSPYPGPGEGTLPGYACSGCEINDQCYTFGYRKEGQYCSDKEEFVSQSEDESVCENNFECDSNVCVSGECVSQGLIKNILNWFKKIF